MKHAADAPNPDERLRELQDRLSISLAAAGAAGRWDWHIPERRLYFDARLATFQGLDAGQAAAGVPVSQFFAAIHPDDIPRIRVAVGGMLRGAEVFLKSYRMIAPDGTVRWVEAHGRCLFDENDQPERFSGILVDTTSRQRVEEQLRIAQTAGGVGTFEYVPGFGTATVSEQFCRLLGLEPAPVLPVSVINSVLVPGSVLLLKQRPEGGLKDGEYCITRPDTGEQRWIARRGEVLAEAEGSVGRQIGVIFDVTDLKRAQQELGDLNRTLEQRVEQEIKSRQQIEERLRQSQKMEAIGQLTGGIAHDFNNLLTVIIGNVDMARRRLSAGADEKVQRALGNALKSSERAASLTQRLLAFSRRQSLDPIPVDVARLVHGMFDLLNRSLGEKIELETEFEEDLWHVEADPNQLESAILNLAVNARDAMNSEGALTISAKNVEVESSMSDDPTPAGDYVELSVRDSGPGMSAAVIERAFEPFYTTKEVGKGTGLGLSMVFGFVRQSGGDVRIVSEPWNGTTVHLLLPRCEIVPVVPLIPDSKADGRKPRATILIVEDDADVRAFTFEGLSDLGYEVIQAKNGEGALEILARQPGSIDLLLTDVVMPGLSGRDLVQAVRQEWPDLRVLYMSGYPSDVIARDGRLEVGVSLLSKPFTIQALAVRIEEVLNASTI